MSWQNALSGAASGAATGSMFGPWGTVIGGGLGALSGIFGDDDDEEPTPGPQASAQQYNDLPDWLKSPAQDIVNRIGTTASRGWTPLTGTLPGASSLQESAFSMAPGAAGTWRPYMQNASQSPLELMRSGFMQDPAAVQQAMQANFQTNVANPLARRYAQGMAGTGEGLSTQGMAAMGKGIGEASAMETLNEQNVANNLWQQGLQNANQYIGQQAGLAGTASGLGWGDVNQTAGIGGQQRGIGAEQAQWDLNLQNLNQNTGPLQYLQAAGSAMSPFMRAMGSTSTFSSSAPPPTQTMNPWSAAGQGVLGGLQMYNQFNKS